MSQQHARQRLLTVRGELEARLVRMYKHIHREEPVSANFHEQAVETGNDEVVLALEDESRRELRQVRKALARIDSGDYANCSNCGAAIGEERLDAIPWTELCSKCA
jgi:DnaK suppressor protein